MKSDFMRLIESRHSIRAFKPTAVPDADIRTMIDAVRRAPSAGNRQAFRIFISKTKEIKEKLAVASYNQAFVADAPLVFTAFADVRRSAAVYSERGRLYAVQDATIAVTYLMLAARSIGYDSCWVGAYEDDAVRAVFGQPEPFVPVAILPVGLAAEQPFASDRRPEEEVFLFK